MGLGGAYLSERNLIFCENFTHGKRDLGTARSWGSRGQGDGNCIDLTSEYITVSLRRAESTGRGCSGCAVLASICVQKCAVSHLVSFQPRCMCNVAPHASREYIHDRLYGVYGTGLTEVQP